MAGLVLLTPTHSKDKRSSIASQSTPIRYGGSSAASYCVTAISSTSAAALEVLGKSSVACKTRIEQLEFEFLMALDGLSTTSDSDDESGENAAKADFLQNRAHQDEEPQSRYRLAREKYKTELWNQYFEPVLQRIRVAAAAITNADLEDNAKSEAVRRLLACGCIVQKEKDVLDGLLGECVRMGSILADVGLFLGTLSGAGERCGVSSDGFYGTRETTDATPTQNQEQEANPVPADRFKAELPETTSKPEDSKTEKSTDFRAYCDHIFTSLQNLHLNSNEGSPSTFSNNGSAVWTVSAPLISYLYAAVTEHIAAAQLRAENSSLSVAMDREWKQLNDTFAELQYRNEEDLSLAAGLLIEVGQVQAQVERVRTIARADLGVSVNVRKEVARLKGVE